MKDERGNIVIAFSGYVVLLLWTVLPDRGIIKPFLLSEQEIASQTYVWIATIYAAFLLMTWVMYRSSDRARNFFEAAFILQACQFIEYFINYNETWTRLAGIPITVATLRFPILFYYAFKTFARWNK